MPLLPVIGLRRGAAAVSGGSIFLARPVSLMRPVSWQSLRAES